MGRLELIKHEGASARKYLYLESFWKRRLKMVMVIEKEKEWEKEATRFLRDKGLMWDGRKKEEVGKTIFLKPQTGIGHPRPYYK